MLSKIIDFYYQSTQEGQTYCRNTSYRSVFVSICSGNDSILACLRRKSGNLQNLVLVLSTPHGLWQSISDLTGLLWACQDFPEKFAARDHQGERFSAQKVETWSQNCHGRLIQHWLETCRTKLRQRGRACNTGGRTEVLSLSSMNEGLWWTGAAAKCPWLYQCSMLQCICVYAKTTSSLEYF